MSWEKKQYIIVDSVVTVKNSKREKTMSYSYECCEKIERPVPTQSSDDTDGLCIPHYV